MKRGSLFLFVSVCGSLLMGCGKKSPPETDTPPSATKKPAREVTKEPITNIPPAATNIVLTNAAAAMTNASVAPVAPVVEKRTYPAQDLYERGLAIIKTNLTDAAAKEALSLFQDAAEKGNAPAQHALGLSYLGGIGVTKDTDEGVKWLQKSADAGFANAQFKMASLYARGGVLPEDDDKAAQFARLAAEQGHAEAQYNLGTLYALGRGVPKDLKQAEFWFRKAAEAGQAAAQSNMGVLYANGNGVEKNMDEALKWWRKAAEQGQPSAQFNLAQALTEGKAVKKDLVEAYKWYHLAAEQGDKQAAEYRDSIGVDLQPSEVAEALKEARLFRTELMTRRAEQREALF